MGAKKEKTSLRKRLSASLAAFADDERGATAIEYSLIAGLIFLAIVSSIRAYTATTSGMYNEIEGTLNNAIN